MTPTLIHVDDTHPAAHHSGKRDPSKIRWVVLHSTEGNEKAAGAVAWFQNEECQGSTHLVVGTDGAFRCLPDDVEPWAAPGANAEGLHIELAGHASFHPGEWMKHPSTLNDAAALVAEWCNHYDIPPEFLAADALHDEASRGITTHAEVTHAFKKGDHWDPGQGFPMDYFLGKVKEFLAQYPAKPEPPPSPSSSPSPEADTHDATDAAPEVEVAEEPVPVTLDSENVAEQVAEAAGEVAAEVVEEAKA